MNRSTLDIGLDALTATDSGAGTAVAVMGAMVVGAAAVGMAKRLNEWGETAAQEKARLAAEAKMDAAPPKGYQHVRVPPCPGPSRAIPMPASTGYQHVQVPPCPGPSRAILAPTTAGCTVQGVPIPVDPKTGWPRGTETWAETPKSREWRERYPKGLTYFEYAALEASGGPFQAMYLNDVKMARGGVLPPKQQAIVDAAMADRRR